MEDGAVRSALLAQHPQHVVVAVAVVDLQRQVEPLGQLDVGPERVLLGPRRGASSWSVRKRSIPVSPTTRTRGCAASRSISARPSSRVPSAASRGARFGWIATPPTSCGKRSTAPTVQRAASRSQPICTDRGTPTRSAASSSAATVASSASWSRWVWSSTTPVPTTGSGSGRGGRTCESDRRCARPRVSRRRRPEPVRRAARAPRRPRTGRACGTPASACRRRADDHGARLPARRRRVVAGDHRVGGEPGARARVELVDLLDDAASGRGRPRRPAPGAPRWWRAAGTARAAGCSR